MPVSEIMTVYGARPEGSASKLSTYRDGWRILRTIFTLYRIEKPILFFGIIATLLAAAGIILATPLIITYIETGLVPRFPTAILVTGLMILATLSGMCGLILDTVVRGRRTAPRATAAGRRRRCSTCISISFPCGRASASAPMPRPWPTPPS